MNGLCIGTAQRIVVCNEYWGGVKIWNAISFLLSEQWQKAANARKFCGMEPTVKAICLKVPLGSRTNVLLAKKGKVPNGQINRWWNQINVTWTRRYVQWLSQFDSARQVQPSLLVHGQEGCSLQHATQPTWNCTEMPGKEDELKARTEQIQGRFSASRSRLHHVINT